MVDGGFAVGFLIVIYGTIFQKSDGVIMQGFSAGTFSTRLYWKLWGKVVKTALLK